MSEQDKTHVVIDYTNHAGLRQVREIIPNESGLHFDKSQWHPEEQWLLDAYDLGKGARRTFAMKDIHGWYKPTDPAQPDVSIARQLQRSMERNARMSNRLRSLQGRINNHQPSNEVYDATSAIEAILNDKDPA